MLKYKVRREPPHPSQYETEFSQRMYIYNYRAFDLYHKPVVSLAILGDERMNWRPSVYNYAIGGCRVSFEFPVVKLLDYEAQWDTLGLNTNPFAVIVMAHLKTKATTTNPQQREQWKWSLIRGLYDRGKTKEEIVKLFQIIDKMMTLPKQLQQSLNGKIQRFEEESTMPLSSQMEEMAIERGKEIGALQKSHDAVITVLNARFNQIPSEIQYKVTQISDLSVLEEVLKLAATVNSQDDFSQFFQLIKE